MKETNGENGHPIRGPVAKVKAMEANLASDRSFHYATRNQ